MRARLQLTFAGAEPAKLVEGAVASGLLPAEPPTSLKVARKPARRALADAVAGADDVAAAWGDVARLTSSQRNDDLYLDHADRDVTPAGTLALLRDLPFEACTTGPLDDTWWPEHRSIHGWAFALKGRGHRLVSPRVIERGPWRLWRDDAADLTLFQFHALDVDGDTALAQARPGHALLAPMWLGGHYASRRETFRGAAAGYQPTFYDKARRTSIVLVQEREVPASEMGIAAGTRIHQVFPDPIEQVAFVYMDEAVARRQLPDLWLYGLEVRAMTAAGERRIDEEYRPPPPEVPAWVNA